MIRTRNRARGGSGTPWQLQLKADGVDPTLAMQFDRQRYAANNATKSFADILGATRSTTGTYFDASGVMREAAINEMRFDHDPVTGESLGLLLEGSRTNLLTYSVPTTGQWGISGSTDTYDAQVSPDGLTKATLSTANIGTSASFSNCNNVSFSSGVVYTSSVFVKAGTSNRVQLTLASIPFGGSLYANFLLDGDGSVTAFSGVVATINKCSNGWYRISITATCISSSSGTGLAVIKIKTGFETRIPSITWDGTETIQFWGAQTEQAAFQSSYIPTSGSAVTRAAEVVLNNASNTVPFASWYNQSEGCLVTESRVSFDTATTSRRIAEVGDGGAGHRYMHQMEGGVGNLLSIFITTGGITQFSLVSAVSPTDFRKVASAIKAGGSLVIDGSVIGVDGTLTPPTVNKLSIGSASGSASNFLEGHLRSLYYYPVRVTDAELQRITT